MLILGIESSCDDTSVALVDCSENGCVVVSQKTASQIEIHKKYGGVVPEIAGRMHAEKIVPLIEEVMTASPPPLGAPPHQRGRHVSPPLGEGLTGRRKPDAIAVTTGPGLITGLIVGTEAAKTLSYVWDVPLVSVNHIEGHVNSVEIESKSLDSGLLTLNERQILKSKDQRLKSAIVFPALCLIVSGGHTELILMSDHGDYEILGATKDDAAGECFDKVAKLLGLPYPGGPEISKLAESGRTDAIDFPRPMIREDNFDFSFSGLKTSALYWLRDNPLPPPREPLLQRRGHVSSPSGGEVPRGAEGRITLADFCASFEQSIVDVLVAKTIRAAEKIKPKTIILAGGVSANKKLRETLASAIQQSSYLQATSYKLPPTQYSMDNAAMIAVAGYYKALKKEFTSWKEIDVNPNWKIDE